MLIVVFRDRVFIIFGLIISYFYDGGFLYFLCFVSAQEGLNALDCAREGGHEVTVVFLATAGDTTSSEMSFPFADIDANSD